MPHTRFTPLHPKGVGLKLSSLLDKKIANIKNRNAGTIAGRQLAERSAPSHTAGRAEDMRQNVLCVDREYSETGGTHSPLWRWMNRWAPSGGGRTGCCCMREHGWTTARGAASGERSQTQGSVLSHPTALKLSSRRNCSDGGAEGRGRDEHGICRTGKVPDRVAGVQP